MGLAQPYILYPAAGDPVPLRTSPYESGDRGSILAWKSLALPIATDRITLALMKLEPSILDEVDQDGIRGQEFYSPPERRSPSPPVRIVLPLQR